MPVNSPQVSVIMPAYNNQETIAEAIQSVLDQTFPDFELIVINDGSEDRTGEIVEQFNDPRIIYRSQHNQGASQAANQAIGLASGKYIAIFAADDICHPERLARQYHFLNETGYKVVFTWVDFIDDEGQLIEGPHFGQGYFNHPQRTQAEMLNWFFFKGNYLCTVTCMAEKELFVEAGLFRTSSAQIPDLWMWGKLVKKVELAMLPEKLLKYRIRGGEGNVSGPHNAPRAMFEGREFHRHLLDRVPIKLFKEAFARHLKNPDFEEGLEYELEKAFLYLQHDMLDTRLIGAEKLSDLFTDINVAEISRTKYGFGLTELFLLTKSLQISGGLESIKWKEDILYLEQTHKEMQKYILSLEKEIKKSEEYAKSLEPAYQEAQKYLKSLEPAYQEAQNRLNHLEPAYQETQNRLNQLEGEFSQVSALLEKALTENQTLQANQNTAIKELGTKLDQSVTANQELQTTLARYEKDLRQLQATRTVRLANFLGRVFKKF